MIAEYMAFCYAVVDKNTRRLKNYDRWKYKLHRRDSAVAKNVCISIYMYVYNVVHYLFEFL
jgi:hypothetical protein